MEKAISSDLIRGHIDTIILHTLLEGDKFAQQISDFIEKKSDGQYKINQATLYSSLKRLEGLKFVNSYWYDTVGGRRKYFKLTASGKSTVEENLSSWSFSRAIIDKLMDCEAQPIYKTQYIEKIVEVEKKVADVVSVSPIQTEKETVKQESPVLSQNESLTLNKDNENKELVNETNQDINFRNVLNGLIKATAIQKKEQNTELEPLQKTDIQEKPSEKLKFNETLSSTDYNAQKANNNGKIDFGDITLKAAKEGYKIRISSKDSAVSEGKLLINKLNLYVSVLMLFITAIEFLYFSLRHGSLLKINYPIIITVVALLIINPVLQSVKYIKNPKKTSPKRVSAELVLTTAIVVFNLLLITFSANLLCNVDFSNKFTILLYLVIPTVLYLDIFVYCLIKFLFSKSSACLLKKQQKNK